MQKSGSSEVGPSQVAVRAAVNGAAPPEGRAGAGGVTLRAVLLAFLLLVLFAPAGFYGELVYGSTYGFAAGIPSMGALLALFLITLANGLVRRRGGGGMSRAEVLTVYAIVLVGGPLMSHGILAWMVGHNLTPRQLARAFPQWQNTFLPFMPWWFSPTNIDTVDGYFTGGMSVPWGQWAVPLAAWSSFAGALFCATLCFMLLFRNQWITNERLAFPTAQIPLEFVREEEGKKGGAARLPSSPLFWIGFGIVLVIGVINTLSSLYPSIPGIPLSGKVLMQWIPVGPMAGLGSFELSLEPPVIGIAYLIPKELSFSCWFFYMIRVAETVGAIAAGATPQPPEGWYDTTFPAPYCQGSGAAIALGLWVLWVARRHLARAFRLAVTGRQDPQDPRSPMTYRWILLGFIISFAYMVCFCVAAGSRAWFAVILVSLIIAMYVMWARLRAETGLGFLSFPLGVEEMMMLPFGSVVFRPKEIVTLIGLRWTYFPGFGESSEVITGNSLEAFKIADSAKIRERRLLVAIVAGFVLAFAAGLWILMWGMYQYGFYNINCANAGWLQNQMRVVGSRMHTMFTDPTQFDLSGSLHVLGGGLLAIGLGLMRLRFWWWPLHPFGYLAANLWGMQGYWQCFFLGWAVKSLVIRYGGLRLYRTTVPLAVGCIMGSMVGQGLHVLVRTIVKSQM